MTTKYHVGDTVPMLGACGHPLIVEDITFAGSIAPTEDVTANPRNAYYYLRCITPGCERRYCWREAYGDTPRTLKR